MQNHFESYSVLNLFEYQEKYFPVVSGFLPSFLTKKTCWKIFRISTNQNIASITQGNSAFRFSEQQVPVFQNNSPLTTVLFDQSKSGKKDDFLHSFGNQKTYKS